MCRTLRRLLMVRAARRAAAALRLCIAWAAAATLLLATAAIAYSEPVYDLCIEDNDKAGKLQLNVSSGHFVLCLPDGTVLSGRAVKDEDSNSYQLNVPGSFTLDAAFNPFGRPLTGSVILTRGAQTLRLIDSEIGDGHCDCRSPGSVSASAEIAEKSPIELAAVAVRGDTGDDALVVALDSADGQSVDAIVARRLDGLTGQEVNRETLAAGSHFALRAAVSEGGPEGDDNVVVVTAVDFDFQHQLLAVDEDSLLVQNIIQVGGDDTVRADVAPHSGGNVLVYRQDFAGVVHRDIRNAGLDLVGALSPVAGVGTSFFGRVEPSAAGDGAGNHLLIYQQASGDDLVALCHQNGVDTPIKLDDPPISPQDGELRSSVPVWDPLAQKYFYPVGDGASGDLQLHTIDCGAGTAKSTRLGSWPATGFFFNQPTAIPLGGDTAVFYCHHHSEGSILAWYLTPGDDDPHSPQQGFAGECTPGPMAYGPGRDRERQLFFPGNSLDGAVFEAPAPEAPAGPWLTSPELPGYRFKVTITGGSRTIPARLEPCIAETACLSGAVAGRSELFLRVVGPKPNGHLWPNLVRFSASRIQVWVEQPATGTSRYYDLPAVGQGGTQLDLAGLAHKTGFLPPFDGSAAVATALGGTLHAGVELAADGAGLGAARKPWAAAADPSPPASPWLETPAVPGFRFKVRISTKGGSREGRRERACIEETICVSGAVAGRAELFGRVVGPKPNGHLWPILVKFSASRIEVWIEQTAGGVIRYYELPAVAPGGDLLELAGLADKLGFRP